MTSIRNLFWPAQPSLSHKFCLAGSGCLEAPLTQFWNPSKPVARIAVIIIIITGLSWLGDTQEVPAFRLFSPLPLPPHPFPRLLSFGGGVV
jgi:hypothetical protein